MSAIQDVWLRRFHPAAKAPAPQALPSTAKRRLVCFPHAGGSATFFFPASAALSPDIEVLAVQYPGRQDRRAEQPIDDLGRLADEIVAALSRTLAGGPALFGHSMGAVVAFEVASRMERDLGAAPAMLVASGRRAPSRYRHETVHRYDDQGLIAELRRLSGTADALLGDAEFLQAILPAIRNDYRAIETYRCPEGAIVSCPITVFVGDADPKVTLDEAQAWKEHTTAAFDMRVFPGGHFYLADQPERALVALKEVLCP